jgi:hypothetical protein
MLQQNGPTGQNNVEVIDITPDRQCTRCGCQTMQSRCPECGYAIRPANHAPVVRISYTPKPLRVYWICRQDEAGQFQRKCIVLAGDHAAAARAAVDEYHIPEDEVIKTEDLGLLSPADRKKAYEQEVERQLEEIHQHAPMDEVEPEELATVLITVPMVGSVE